MSQLIATHWVLGKHNQEQQSCKHDSSHPLITKQAIAILLRQTVFSLQSKAAKQHVDEEETSAIPQPAAAPKHALSKKGDSPESSSMAVEANKGPRRRNKADRFAQMEQQQLLQEKAARRARRSVHSPCLWACLC